MARLVLNDKAFGTLGIVISEQLNLDVIAQSLSDVLNFNFTFDALDLTAVTRTNLEVTGSAAEFDTLTFDDLGILNPLVPITSFTNVSVGPDFIINHPNDGANPYVFDFDGSLGVGQFTAGNDSIRFEPGLSSFGFQSLTDDLEIRVNYPDGVRSVVVIGGEGGDSIRGADGDDVFFGNAGDDELNGQGGNDELFGDDGDDAVLGSRGDDQLLGGEGNDSLLGGTGSDDLYGGSGHDSLRGDAQANNEAAAGARDRLFGGSPADDPNPPPNDGNDFLRAGDSQDWMWGGTDRDSFYFITDFQTDDPSATEFPEQWDIVKDFTIGEDLIIFDVDDEALQLFGSDDLFEFYFYDIDADTAGQSDHLNPGDSVIEFYHDRGSDLGSGWADFRATEATVVDEFKQIRPDQVLIQVEQTAGQVLEDGTDPLQSGRVVQDLSWLPGESFLSGSYVVKYRPNRKQSSWEEQDEFHHVQLQANPDAAGILSGQDKFDLRSMSFNDTESAAIIFTQVDSGFTGTAAGPGFFQDEQGINRGVKIEWDDQYIGGDESEIVDALMVYVDANRDGEYTSDEDLAFLIYQPLDGDGLPFDGANDDGVFTAEDFYDPENGTGIFLFDGEQTDFWFA